MSKGKRRQGRSRGKRKNKADYKNTPATMPKGGVIPLRHLPLYKFIETEPNRTFWYGLLPEIICIQGEWIDKHLPLITVPNEAEPYLKNAVSLHHTALLVAGNDRAYFSLYSLRAILERVAMAWTLHSTSSISMLDILTQLRSIDISMRKAATRSFMEFAAQKDSVFNTLYDMVSQYFAHASKMDGVALGNTSEKDKLLQMRAKTLPLLLLFDAGQRIVVLIEALLDDQGIPYESAKGGRVTEGFSFNLDKYVRVCTYVTCEKHSRQKGVPMSTLYSGIKEIEGKVGINTIYRGGMELMRFGDPTKRPDPREIAHFAWYAIGRGHDDKVKVKCEKEYEEGETYRLSWPKSLELDSAGLAMVAAHSQGQEFPYFDYVDEFLKVIEKHETTKEEA